jgi:hypothetical protein
MYAHAQAHASEGLASRQVNVSQKHTVSCSIAVESLEVVSMCGPYMVFQAPKVTGNHGYPNASSAPFCVLLHSKPYCCIQRRVVNPLDC